MAATDVIALPKTLQTRNLTLATIAFALTFWAWNLIGPLAIRYSEQLSLTTSQKSLLVATRSWSGRSAGSRWAPSPTGTAGG